MRTEARIEEHLTQRRVLSPREQEVGRLIGEGKTNAEIAAELGISEQTVKNHMLNISSKSGGMTRVELALKFTNHFPANW